jgi:hypothetical protein
MHQDSQYCELQNADGVKGPLKGQLVSASEFRCIEVQGSVI